MKKPDRLSNGQLIKLHDFYLKHYTESPGAIHDTVAALAELVERRGMEAARGVTLSETEKEELEVVLEEWMGEGFTTTDTPRFRVVAALRDKLRARGGEANPC